MRRCGIGIAAAPVDDTMLLSYALDGGKGNHGYVERHLAHTPMDVHQVIEIRAAGQEKKSDRTFAGGVPIDKATEYAAEDADVTLRLWLALKPRLAAERMTTVYETLERPLLPVLADVECAGIKVLICASSRLSSGFRAGHRASRRRSAGAGRASLQSRQSAPARRTAV